MLNWQRQVRKEDKQALHEAIQNTKNFNIKIAWLKEKWLTVSKRIGDCPAVREISRAIFQFITPINASIIVDNISFFMENYDPLKEIEGRNELDVQGREKLAYMLEESLKIACMCGSQNIAEFLLQKLETSDADRLTKYADFMLSYVSASPNEEWAKEIATEMKKANMDMPKNIYSYTDYHMKETIRDIFEKNPPKAKIR